MTKPQMILAVLAATLLAANCFAQTGILDSEAEYRDIPRQAMELMRAQPDLSVKVLPPPTPQPRGYYPVESENVKISPALDSLNRYLTERPVAGTRRKGNNPVLFLIGDSTMRTEIDGNGLNGQWGWGYYIANYFDTQRISIENHGLGGESTRSYFRTLLFPLLRGVQPGDWVIIQLGHNDQHGREWADGRFRGILPGTSKEVKEVILPGNGTRERIYTYGEYLRMYVNEIRKVGANPLLLSLTSRKSFAPDGKTNPDRNTAAIKEIAEEMNVPFIDFNAAIRYKYDNVFDRKKVEYLYFSDGIHSSSFGAVINAETFVEELRKRPDIALSNYLLPEKRYESPARQGDKPVLFVVGDSTGKIDNSEQSGQVGWGQVMQEFVNTNKITVDNHAKAGRSARTFLDEGRWNKVYDALRPGDYVIIQFGHNDGGPINVGKARGEMRGNSDEKKVMTMEANGIHQGIYSYGWYIRKFCLDVIEKGATPIVLSVTPSNVRDENGKIRRDKNFKDDAREAASQVGAYFVDFNEISAADLDKLSVEQANAQFQRDHVHSSMEGARRNARCVAKSLKTIKELPLRKMLK